MRGKNRVAEMCRVRGRRRWNSRRLLALLSERSECLVQLRIEGLSVDWGVAPIGGTFRERSGREGIGTSDPRVGCCLDYVHWAEQASWSVRL